MEGFFSWARNFSYDLIALALPGFAFIIGLAAILERTLPLEILFEDSQSLEDRWLFSLALYLLASYLTGILLKWCTSADRIKKIYRNGLANYSPIYEKLYSVAKLKIENKFDLPTGIGSWNEFYLLVKTYVHQEGIPSTLTTFQNRYELSNSLSFGFAALSGTQFAIILWQLKAANYLTSGIHIESLLILALLLLLSFVFFKSFRKYWTEMGSQTIAHALILKEP